MSNRFNQQQYCSLNCICKHVNKKPQRPLVQKVADAYVPFHVPITSSATQTILLWESEVSRAVSGVQARQPNECFPAQVSLGPQILSMHADLCAQFYRGINQVSGREQFRSFDVAARNEAATSPHCVGA
jgi:hypothetical protein